MDNARILLVDDDTALLHALSQAVSIRMATVQVDTSDSALAALELLQAQEIKLRGAGQMVLGHTDWGVKHFRYVGERIRVIYDWDSLAFEKEPIIVGHASRYFTYTEFFGESRQPTNEEACAFVAEYEAARGKPFTHEEHQTLKAAKIYGLAYGARCEHALNPRETTYPEGSCRSLLARYRSLRSEA